MSSNSNKVIVVNIPNVNRSFFRDYIRNKFDNIRNNGYQISINELDNINMLSINFIGGKENGKKLYNLDVYDFLENLK